MNMPVNIQIDEFIKLGGHMTFDEITRAEKMFRCFTCDKTEGSQNFINLSGLAALYMAGYVSGVRNERARRHRKGGAAV